MALSFKSEVKDKILFSERIVQSLNNDVGQLSPETESRLVNVRKKALRNNSWYHHSIFHRLAFISIVGCLLIVALLWYIVL